MKTDKLIPNQLRIEETRFFEKTGFLETSDRLNQSLNQI
ncbi:hypothetical protein AmaxDRAFT_5502 [Limnospira maxima CS-328]|uniref:Uncharacterized protein n=1 Tax=Limnospira maxima CS-328 TaxID=513049 RepID=B5W9Q2_LIMMA|nr:hypothetical protein AmaxDRAFT_5502 [Limnospira maxima CS-328]